MDVFSNLLWKIPEFRAYLQQRYAHVIADNLEEDTPVAHDLLADWLPDFSSALLIADREAGYRRFLGADPDDVARLKSACQSAATLEESFVSSPGIELFGSELRASLGGKSPAQPARRTRAKTAGLSGSLEYSSSRFHAEMIAWVVAEIKSLVQERGTPPEEIVILAPYLSDALRFSIMRQLDGQGIPVRSHRPSRGLRDEPATQCLLALAALAHPAWDICPNSESVARALMQTIDGLDLVRANLLAQVIYRPKDGKPALNSFDEIKEAEMQARITFLFGQRYQTLRAWIDAYRDQPSLELDYFISRLFGEVLSQPGFGFHGALDDGEVTATLIESIRKFRWEVGPYLGENGAQLGREYVQMVQEGVVAAQYLPKWRAQPEQAVLVAPAYTFLMSNRAVDYQFWLDVGSLGWWRRLAQPLTQPYVLSRAWLRDGRWTDALEQGASQLELQRLTLGLTRRCRQKIYLGLSELGEQGYEQRGPLLSAIQHVLRHYPLPVEAEHV
jgi:hypothetical protein